MHLYHNFIQQSLFSSQEGRGIGLKQKAYFTYRGERRDENFICPTYKLKNPNRTDLLTSCSARFCVGSHTTPSAALF